MQIAASEISQMIKNITKVIVSSILNIEKCKNKCPLKKNLLITFTKAPQSISVNPDLIMRLSLFIFYLYHNKTI